MSRSNLLILFIIISCTSHKPHKEHRTVFRYNETQGISSLDPAFANNERHTRIAYQLFNRLFEFDDSLKMQPSVARHFDVSQKGLEYTFYLRNDVFFHDHSVFPAGKGRKLTANDVAYSFRRLLDPVTASPGSWIFEIINQSALNKGFEVLNDTILRIYLKQPFAAFPELLTMPYTSIVPHEAVEFYKYDFRSHPVGSGPFMFKAWKEGEKLVLIKNPNYFEKDSSDCRLPYVDAVSITFIKDKQSEFLEFVKGNLDFLSGVQTVYKDEFITRNGKLNPKYASRFVMDVSPYLNTEYLGFMIDSSIIKNNPLLDINVRKAINYGFDRTKMLKYLRNNIGKPAFWGIIPKGMPGYTEDTERFWYNPDTARQLLAKSGYIAGKGNLEITLTTTSDYLDLCEFIQHDLAQIGIRIKIEVSIGATFRDMVANSKVSFYRASWIADYPDAENYLSLFYSHNFSPKGPNNVHFKNETFDTYFEKAKISSNPLERIRLYQIMNELIVKKAAIVPLYYDQAVRFYPVTLKGFTGNPLNKLNLKFVRK